MMRPIVRVGPVGALLLALTACDSTTGPGIAAPANLTYAVVPSGDAQAPAGLLLRWDPVIDDQLEVYNIYSRANGDDPFDLRASTTSTTFHDTGIPDLEYYVTAVALAGEESGPSASVVVDEYLELDAPTTLATTTLDAAVHLAWSDNAYQANQGAFRQYRVYSTFYDLDANLCDATWVLEGTTIAPEYLVAALPNGVPRCFAVAAESVRGFESLWSPIIADTPRPDGRNVLLYPDDVDPTMSGFRFFLDANGDGAASALELGLVGAGGSGAVDFSIFRDVSDVIFIAPERAGVSVAVYGSVPSDDLTSIDVAPEEGFDVTPIEAVPGWGYVFELPGPGDGFARFGALRPTHVSAAYVIVDWAYQIDPGNPELQQVGVAGTGIVVPR